MRKAVLAIATTFVLTAPFTASAEDKHKDWIELQSYSHQNTQPTTSSSQSKKFNIGIFKNTHDKREAHSANGLTSQGPTTTNNPSALKSPNLLTGAGTGATAGRATVKVSPEYTRH
jgi:hypothetical protein